MKSKRYILLFLLWGMIGKSSTAQPGTIEWQRSFGGTSYDIASKCKPTQDNGYLVVGVTNSSDGDILSPLGNDDFWILKLDSAGSLLWSKNLGGSQYDGAVSLDITFDGGFIIGGASNSNDGYVSGNHGDSDYWLVKLDSSGNLEWQQSYGGTDGEGVYDIQQTSDSGYIVAGESYSVNGDVSGQHSCSGCAPDFWIVKLDQGGVIQWERCFGGGFSEICTGITQTTDGGYVAVGWASVDNGDVSGTHGLADYWVIKINSNGVLQWQRCLGGSGNDSGGDVIQTNDGGCLVFGEASSNDGDVTGNHGGWDAWLVKLDSLGNIEWQKCYGGSGYDSGKSIAQYSDSAIFLLTYSDSNDGDVSGNNGDADYWLTKIDSSGTLLWQKCYGGSGDDKPTSICLVNDYEYLLAGSSRSNDGDVSGNHGGNCNGFVCEDFWVVKIGSSTSSTSELEENSKSLQLSYNPFEDKLKVHWKSDTYEKNTLQIFDITGRVLFSKTIDSFAGENNFITNFETSGCQMLMIRLLGENSVYSGNILVVNE